MFYTSFTLIPCQKTHIFSLSNFISNNKTCLVFFISSFTKPLTVFSGLSVADFFFSIQKEKNECGPFYQRKVHSVPP